MAFDRAAGGSGGPERGAESRFPVLSRFEIVRALGRGAAGLVFEARDRLRGTRVALKTLRALDGETLLQLKSEFRSLQDFEHPNLIRLDELMRDGDTWFFTMELVDGVEFDAYVTGASSAAGKSSGGSGERARGEGSDGIGTSGTREVASVPSFGAVPAAAEETRRTDFDEARLRASFAQLARGLMALHAAGKVHRDIKPSNVLVTATGRVVILDFGLVREMSSAPEEYVVGTALYMAPEQFAGEAVEAPCDWYAAGVMLYRCLAGRLPFEGAVNRVMMQKLDAEPPPPSALAEGIPPDLDALCVALLQRDPSARPSGEEVLARLAVARTRDSLVPPPVRPGQRPFVGRAAEFEALSRAFQDVRAGRGVTVVVLGESGIGKSALVRRFTRALPSATPDVLVLTGRCYERESVPYKAVDGIFDALTAHLEGLRARDVNRLLAADGPLLQRVFPVLQQISLEGDGESRASSTQSAADVEGGMPEDARARLFAAVRALLNKLARRQPLVLVIDDMQWADSDSLLLLSEVLRAPGAPPMLLLTTARAKERSGEGGRDDGGLGLPGDVRVLPLARLTVDEGLELASLLVDRAGASVDPALAQALANEAAGHPLFLDELVQHARLTGGPAAVVVDLDQAIHARVSRLDPEARRLLELVATFGAALPQDVAMRAAGIDFEQLTPGLRTLRVAHLARTSSAASGGGAGVVETYHDRVREAVVGRLALSERRARHEAIARAIEDSPRPDADALATHWLAAGDVARGRRYTLRAADQAYRALAFDRAASLYRSALALPCADEADIQRTRVRLGDALANAGRGVEAAAAYADAAAHAPADRVLDLRRRVAEQLLNAGRFDEGEEALHEVLASVGLDMPRTPFTALASLLMQRAQVWFRGMRFEERTEASIPPHELTRLDACAGVAQLLGVVDTIRSAYFETKTLLLALDAGEPGRLAHAMATEAAFLSAQGPKHEARATEVAATAQALAERIGTPQALGAVSAGSAFASFCQGYFPRAFSLSERAVATLRERSLGAIWDLRMAHMISIWALSWMGEVGELAARIEARTREADARGDLYAATCMRAGTPSIGLLLGDDPEAARAIVTSAMRQWTQRGYHNQHYWGMLAEAQIDLYAGDGKAALDRVTSQWAQMKRSLMLEVQIIRIEATNLRARAALAVATRDPATRSAMLKAVTRDTRALEGEEAAYPKPLASLLRGAMAMLGERPDEAQPHFRAAVDGFDACGMRLHANAAKWRLAGALGEAEGAKLREEVLAWARAQGVTNARRMVDMVSPGA